MPSFISNRRLWAPLGWTTAAVLAAVPLQAQAKTFHTVALFRYTPSGPLGPVGGVAADAQGRLYGATSGGGTYGEGTIYRLTPGKLKSDPWTTEVLHSFNGSDGLDPCAGVYIDAAGTVYGTTYFGGPEFAGGGDGQGVVFRLDNAPGWPITILHNFGDFPDAAEPNSALAPGKDGRLYGTSSYGGNGGQGTVFAISPLGDSVSYEIIHAFIGGKDGAFPGGPVIQGDGAIYGIVYAGLNGYGVFRLAEKNDGWHARTIYAPTTGGYVQLGYPLIEPGGNLSLCSFRSSTSINGYVIQLSPPPVPGPWIENDLYAFGPDLGCDTLTINPSGGFVGTSSSGGRGEGDGSLFSLTQSTPGSGAYSARTLYRFPGLFEAPNSELLRLGGLYYGTSTYGSVFDFRP